MDNSSQHERLANRIALILLQLFKEGMVSRRELAERFKVTERTIYRDLNRLGEFVTCSKDGIYHISVQNKSEDKLPTLDSLSEKTGMRELLPLSGIGSLQNILTSIEYKRIKILPLSPEILSSELQKNTFFSLDKAIKENLVCVIHYKGKSRTLHPYRLMNLKGVWYLAATDAELMIKAFRVSAIEWLDIKKTTFIPDSNIHDYLDSEDDAWFSMDKMEVMVEVFPDIACYFERRNILPQQKIISKSLDGRLILTTRIAHREQLFSTLRFWLPNVRILSPVTEANAFVGQLSQYIAQLTQENDLVTNNVLQDNV
ncbi:transcriptional regulator [Proteus mirabilis]|uniref:helix-turn-helix transcriptional regulator n=1 Tax=Proteus mirabilis TaxID=584 RepID=UPI00073C2023|nr:WYL domain-containing transcriptional regulator [Proteus mirabilis]EMA1122556.1 WYL domain-containing transcriptional regulator [Proteus mirabilis]KSW15270.1 transcriptional regulator [Proteus mirabilis]MDM3692123.1 WYL domain-containing transcriptional regulator [Proteus mirabilis]MDW8540745.1 WYL domain-containing transcriptional regulator [Proteus mirabilis]